MSTDLVAVNLTTGEVLEHLEQQPPSALAETLADIHARQAEMKRWQDALEGELRRRLKIQQVTGAVYGEWEVNAARARESVWDAAELEPALQRLADEGVIRPGDWTGVITREPVVSKSKARDLLAQLDGDAAETVKACRTWKDKPGKLTVTRSIALVAPEQGSLTPPPPPEPSEPANPAEAPPKTYDFFRLEGAAAVVGGAAAVVGGAAGGEAAHPDPTVEETPPSPAANPAEPRSPVSTGSPRPPAPPPPLLDPEELFA